MAARHKSFTAASKELSVSQSAISHEVKALEKYYGTALFRRTRSGLVLTREGRRLYSIAGGAFSDLESLGLDSSHFDVSGLVTLAAPPLFCANWLMPHIQNFSKHYPHVEFRLINATEDRPELVREVDLMVIWDPDIPDGMIGENLLTITQSPVASPKLFGDGIPPRKVAEELYEYRVLHEADQQAWKSWCETAGIDDFTPKQQWFLDDPALMIEATERGYGIGMGAFPLNSHLVKEGKLIRLFNDEFESEKKYFIARSEESPGTPQSRLFFDWVKRVVSG